MIESTAEYKAAITADARRILLKAIINISDPDMTYGAITSSGEAAFSRADQLIDKEFSPSPNYATLEKHRWLLNGKCKIIPENNIIPGQAGFVGDSLSGDGGTFDSPVWVEISFANVDILQAFSVYFPDNAIDGCARDFTVEVKSGGNAQFTQTIAGNTADHVSFDGFTVNNPDAIRITVSKWSLPSRRMRIPEIILGVYEEWDNDIIAAFDVVQQGDISCMSLPYGTCTLRMDNQSRRFEPRNKDGIFKSIEERQGIDIRIGVRLQNGENEFKRVGIYYQYSGGWKTGDNGLTMTWNLVDIIGLLSGREFIPPAVLPTTLKGWLASIVSQLGSNFASYYKVDSSYADIPVAANSADDVAGKSCGDILRYACMASGTWPRADASTGYLAASPLWNEGNTLDLDNMSTYPVVKANADIGAIIFKLYDVENTQYIVDGTSVSSANTVSISNPFIHTTEQADNAARLILAAYGGNQMEITGRGDPASEIGDVDTVWLDEENSTAGRRIYQSFTIQSGVLRNCKSTLLQSGNEVVGT